MHLRWMIEKRGLDTCCIDKQQQKNAANVDGPDVSQVKHIFILLAVFVGVVFLVTNVNPSTTAQIGSGSV